MSGGAFRRVIRNKETGLYLLADGSWTADILLAKDFKDTLEAINEGLKLNLNGACEIILNFGPPQYDIRFSL